MASKKKIASETPAERKARLDGKARYRAAHREQINARDREKSALYRQYLRDTSVTSSSGNVFADLALDNADKLLEAAVQRYGLPGEAPAVSVECKSVPPGAVAEEDHLSKEQQLIANLRAVNKGLESRLKALEKDSTATACVVEAVREIVTAFPPVPAVHAPTYAGKRAHEPQHAVLQACCLHMGEVVSEAETNGFGGYNMAIAQARVQRIVDGIIDIAKDHHSAEHISKLWIVNLGDNISGDLHQELCITNERPVMTQVLSAAFLWALAIRDLCANFEEVEMVGLPGNHGRNQKKPAHKEKAEDSFDRMVYETAGLLCANLKNFKCTIPGSFFTRLVINDSPFVFLHGDNLKAWNTIPFYSLNRANSNYLNLYAQRSEWFKYLGVGHFHQIAQLPRTGGEILMTGSLKGCDEFSLDVLQQGAAPAQLFYGVHKTRGISFRYHLDASEATPENHTRYLFKLTDMTLADMARKIGLL